MNKRELRDVISQLERKNERLTRKLDHLQIQKDHEKGLKEGKDKGEIFSIDIEPLCNIVKEAEGESKNNRKEMFVAIGSGLILLSVISMLVISWAI